MIKKILSTIIIIAVIVLSLYLQRKYFPVVKTQTITVTDTIFNDKKIFVEVPKPYPVYRDTGSTKIIELPPDSAAIAKAYLKLYKDFFAINYYNDTLKNDTIAFISLQEKVSQNQVQSRSFVYQNRQPTVINTTTKIINKPKNQLYIGLQGGVNNISPGIMLKTKKGYQIKLSYDFVGPEKGITAGFYTEIF